MGTPGRRPQRAMPAPLPFPGAKARPGLTRHLRPVATDLVNPELAHDDVVNGGGDFPPDIVIPAGVELEVDGACGERNSPKLGEGRRLGQAVGTLPQSTTAPQHRARPWS